MDFPTAVNLLERLGVTFTTDDEKFTSVSPNLSSNNWMSLACSEGNDYLGGCCGNLSTMQDIVCKWFRHNTFHVPVEELAEVAEIMNHHDGTEDTFTKLPWEWAEEDWGKPGPIPQDWQGFANWLPPTEELMKMKPWVKFGIIWQLVKDNFKVKPPTRTFEKSEEDVEGALRILERAGFALGMHGWIMGKEGPRTRDKVRRAQMLAKLIPAIKLVYEKAHILDLGGFEGFALIDVEAGEDVILSNGYGLCLFATEAEVDETLALRREKKTGIRPIRVGFELPGGYEFTGPIARTEMV